jgi:Aspartyl protease
VTPRLSRSLVGVILVGIVSICLPALAAAASSSTVIRQSIAAATARAEGAGCLTSVASVPGATVPVGIVKEGRVRVVLVGVCIDGQGPFVFALDTGASSSFVAQALATRLNLPASGAVVTTGVVGCRAAPVQPVGFASWSAGGLVLDPQSVVAGHLGKDDDGLGLEGLLGSDVLSRFGAIRIDYRNQTLAVESTEGAAPGAAITSVAGPMGSPTAFDLMTAPRVDVGIDVVSVPGATVAAALIRAAGHLWLFIVDTGSAWLVVGTVLAKTAKLDTVSKITLSATNCHSVVRVYASTRGLRLGSYRLRPQALYGLPGTNSPGIDGLLGSTVLSRFGVLVVDYSEGRLLLSA